MDKPMPDFMFRGMSLMLRCRDLFRPRERILEEVGLKHGYKVLDFGCGPGSYSKIVARYVGENGRIYALDIHPLAVRKLQDIAREMGLKNLEAICSNCATGLPSESIDVVLLYDVFHMLHDKQAVLSELHRVIKSDGVLSVSDHHMKKSDIISKLTNTGIFELMRKGKYTYSFHKASKKGDTRNSGLRM